MIGRIVRALEPGLVVSLFYPAASGTLFKDFLEWYRPFQQDAATVLTGMGLRLENLDFLKGKLADEPPVDSAASSYPVVVWSPGFGVERDMYFKLIEKMVERRYIVVTVGAPGESVFTVDPSGLFIRQEERFSRLTGEDHEGWSRRLEARTQAIGRTLQHLQQLQRSDPVLQGRLDLDRVAAAGHSLGGAAVFEAMKAWPLLKAGVLLDPSFHLIREDQMVVETPALVLRQEASSYEAMAAVMKERLAKAFIRGQQYAAGRLKKAQLYRVPGAGHMSFSDIPMYDGDHKPLPLYDTIGACIARFLDDALNLQPSDNPSSEMEGVIAIGGDGSDLPSGKN